MFDGLFPTGDFMSVYDIDFGCLKEQGIEAVLFDIDNTLVPHNAPADEKIKGFFKRLDAIGMKHCLISNNKEHRVKPFADAVGTQFVCKADKPSKKGYIEAMERLGTNANNTIFIGDQLFTDIWGAKRAGLVCYLVKPIHPKEEIQIVIKRHLEKPVLHFYYKNKKKNK